MTAAIDDARAAARGHEAVVVSHQLPIWTARNALLGKRLWHDPRKRECRLASLTTLTYIGDDLGSVTYPSPRPPCSPRPSEAPDDPFPYAACARLLATPLVVLALGAARRTPTASPPRPTTAAARAISRATVPWSPSPPRTGPRRSSCQGRP